MMEYAPIKHCDWFGSHYHGAQKKKKKNKNKNKKTKKELKTTLLE